MKQLHPIHLTLSFVLDTFDELSKTDCFTPWFVFALQIVWLRERGKKTCTTLYSPIYQNRHCVKKCHYYIISLPGRSKKIAHTRTVNTFKVMFLQAAWGWVSSIINQLPGWYCIVYYCWTHHSRHLKPLIHEECRCVTVMDLVIMMPSSSLPLSFCSVACFTSPIPSNLLP